MRGLSLWWDGLEGPVARGPSLRRRPRRRRGHRRAPASPGCGPPTPCSRRAPHCGWRVLEAEVAGFGASGRNGGWCSALFAASDGRIAREHGIGAGAGHAQGHAARRSTRSARDRRGRGDRLPASRRAGRSSPPATSPRSRGPGPRSRRRGASGSARPTCVAGAGPRPEAGSAPTASSGPPTPRTARRSIRPGWPAGWPTAVERRGGTLYEGTPVRRLEPARDGAARCARTAAGTVRADVVVRATEGWTRRDGRFPARALVPIYSLMVATEPLPPSFWAGGRLAGRETFTDHRHLDHLRAAHRRRPARLRRPRRAVPLRVVRPPALRPRRPGARRARAALVELFPELGRRRGHPRLGRSARRAPGLVLLGRARPGRRDRVGRRLRGRRRVDLEPGRDGRWPT